MGAVASSPVVELFEPFKEKALSNAKDMLLQYRARDFDFGVDASVVTSLIGGDTQTAEVRRGPSWCYFELYIPRLF